MVNNTRVLPARLVGKRGEAKINITLHQRADEAVWRAFAKPAKKLRLGDVVVFSDTLSAEVVHIGEDGERSLVFANWRCAGSGLGRGRGDAIAAHIRRPEGIRDEDAETIRPCSRTKWCGGGTTAGLHFTPELYQALTDKGVKIAEVTLHVGAGTFLPES